MSAATDNSCRGLPPCSACGAPARVLLSVGDLPLCPRCCSAAGVEVRASRELSASLALRLASAPTERRRRHRLSTEQKDTMIANLNRMLREVGHG
jgi:hypothetical protein